MEILFCQALIDLQNCSVNIHSKNNILFVKIVSDSFCTLNPKERKDLVLSLLYKNETIKELKYILEILPLTNKEFKATITI